MNKPEDKKADILFIIKPICEAFGLKEKDYDYIFENDMEILKVRNTRIDCTRCTKRAVVNELLKYIFLARCGKGGQLGVFAKQFKEELKGRWIDDNKTINVQDVAGARRRKAIELGLIPNGGEIAVADYKGSENERAQEIKALRVVLDAIAIKEVEL